MTSFFFSFCCNNHRLFVGDGWCAGRTPRWRQDKASLATRRTHHPRASLFLLLPLFLLLSSSRHPSFSISDLFQVLSFRVHSHFSSNEWKIQPFWNQTRRTNQLKGRESFFLLCALFLSAEMLDGLFVLSDSLLQSLRWWLCCSALSLRVQRCLWLLGCLHTASLLFASFPLHPSFSTSCQPLKRLLVLWQSFSLLETNTRPSCWLWRVLVGAG